MAAENATPGAEDAERFFETEVRPMLVARCLACHGSEKQEAGLRLDSREALLKGSDAEPVVVPGEPDKSPLIHAVRYDGDVKMPPAARLEDKDLALLTTWVKMGVPWGGAKRSGRGYAGPCRARQGDALGLSADRAGPSCRPPSAIRPGPSIR